MSEQNCDMFQDMDDETIANLINFVEASGGIENAKSIVETLSRIREAA